MDGGRLSAFGSVLDLFWICFGSVLDPFWIRFGSVLGANLVETSRHDNAVRAIRSNPDLWSGASDDELLIDLLADLMHYCDANGIDFGRSLRSARAHFRAETDQICDNLRNPGF